MGVSDRYKMQWFQNKNIVANLSVILGLSALILSSLLIIVIFSSPDSANSSNESDWMRWQKVESILLITWIFAVIVTFIVIVINSLRKSTQNALNQNNILRKHTLAIFFVIFSPHFIYLFFAILNGILNWVINF